MTDQEQVQDIPDRRETIEAAFEAAETPAPVAVVASEPTTLEVAAEKEPIGAPAEQAGTPVAETPAPIEAKPEDRAPQAWKAPLKAKWSTLDPEVRQEISRRERETTQVLNDSAQARQLTQTLLQTVQPYQARLQQIGANPIQAMDRLLKADAFLSSAPAAARAQYMATLIKGYGIDIAALDSALAGGASPTGGADPIDSRVEQLLQQRLAPFQSFINQQQQRDQQAYQAQEREAAQTVEQMASDTAKYPHFEAVRSLMADLVEFSASKGQTLTIDTAYNRAIAMDPTISQAVASQTASQILATSTSKAKRALNASSSVAGSPGGSARAAPNASDRRATIEAAFGAVEGR